MLRIWGRISSINVQKVVWTAAELGIAFERIDAGRQFGVNKAEPYLQMNPLGLVPTIEEDGFVLYESDTIVRYLAAKFGRPPFVPDDLRQRARADLWTDWQAKNFSPAFRPAFIEIARTSPDGRNENVIAASLAQATPLMAVLDRHLAALPYVTGDDFTYGDIATGVAVHRWLNVPFDRPSFPYVEAYYRRLAARAQARQAFHLPAE